MQVLYFAWLRERIGIRSEHIETNAKTVAELVDELRQREPRYDLAFSDMTSIKIAVNQELVSIDTSLAGANEVAFFPPMTGG